MKQCEHQRLGTVQRIIQLDRAQADVIGYFPRTLSFSQRPTRNDLSRHSVQYVTEIHFKRVLRAKQLQECMRTCLQMNVKFAFPAKSFL